MADIDNKSYDRETPKLRVEVLEKILDQYECYRIMVEVFSDYIPDNERLIAMAHAAERIYNEVKNCEGINNGN